MSGGCAAFVTILEAGRQRLKMRILAYCLMSNHWHIVPWPRRAGDLSKFVQWISSLHVGRWREHRASVGERHLYQEPEGVPGAVRPTASRCSWARGSQSIMGQDGVARGRLAVVEPRRQRRSTSSRLRRRGREKRVQLARWPPHPADRMGRARKCHGGLGRTRATLVVRPAQPAIRQTTPGCGGRRGGWAWNQRRAIRDGQKSHRLQQRRPIRGGKEGCPRTVPLSPFFSLPDQHEVLSFKYLRGVPGLHGRPDAPRCTLPGSEPPPVLSPSPATTGTDVLTVSCFLMDRARSSATCVSERQICEPDFPHAPKGLPDMAEIKIKDRSAA
jgi:hypothetical protein